MTTIGMQYDVIPGKEQMFVDAFTKVIQSLKNNVPGHKDTHLFEDVHSKGSYVILSEWDRKDDFDAFIASDAFRSIVDWGKSQILRGRPKHTVYANV